MKLKNTKSRIKSSYEHDVELESRLDAYLRRLASSELEEERMIRRRDHWL